jgi:hypothetical protein
MRKTMLIFCTILVLFTVGSLEYNPIHNENSNDIWIVCKIVNNENINFRVGRISYNEVGIRLADIGSLDEAIRLSIEQAKNEVDSNG